MVCLSASSDSASPWSSCLVGVVAGLTHAGVRHAVKKVKVDDPVAVAAVHLAPGIVGERFMFESPGGE